MSGVAGVQSQRGPQIKLNEFGGFRSEHRGWRDEVQAILKLHLVPEDKQVLLLYFALEAGKGRPRVLFSAYSVDGVAALARTDIWKRPNKEYEQEKYIEAVKLLRTMRSAAEPLDRACADIS